MKAKPVFLPFFMLLMLLLSSSCIFDLNSISGTGSITTETRNAKDFTAIELQTAADVQIVKGNSFNVSVSDYQNLIKYLSVEVEESRLIIKKKPSSVHLWNSKAKVIVTLPDPLYSLKLSGSGNMRVRSAFNDLQSLILSGSGNIELYSDCQLNNLEAQISGSGNMNAIGTVQDLKTKISGSGNMQFSQLKAKTGNCSISGSGNTYVFVEENLEAYLSGSGDIIYSGNPVLSSHLSGSGHIHKN